MAAATRNYSALPGSGVAISPASPASTSARALWGSSQLSVYFRNKSSPRPINSPTDPRARTHGLERLSCMYRSLDRLPDPWRFLPSVFRSRRPQLSLAAEGEGEEEGVSMAAAEASTAASAIEASVAASLTEGSVAASPTEGSVAASATDGSLAASAAIMDIAATPTDTPVTTTVSATNRSAKLIVVRG